MSIFNFGGFQSPPRRPLIFPSATSPFCTSPSQLQEVTLDQDVTFSNSMGGGGGGGGGVRSPSARGRSVKEFEEQLANLKKENFNLKLRIYFLEERMGSNFNLDKEDVVKKNVELMVEVESLRKEVQEKHDLLCQAVKAMELEDEEHKKTTLEKDNALEEYRQEIECLKTQYHEKTSETRSESPRSFFSAGTEYFPPIQLPQDFTAQMKELQEKIAELEKDLKEEKESGVAVQLLIDQKEAMIRSLSGDLEEANAKLASGDAELASLQRALEDSKVRQTFVTKKLQEMQQRQPSVTEEICSGLRDELERERRRYDKLRLTSDQKIAELQTQLEASMCELKKSQELVVASKSPSLGLRSNGTDSLPVISVPQPATPPRSARTDAFAVQSPLPSPPTSLPLNVHLQHHHPSIAVLPHSPLSSSPPPLLHQASSPCAEENFVHFDFEALEKTLRDICGGGGAGIGGIREALERLKGDRETMQSKIVKLKAEQLKACKIIKSMIDSRNKSNEEMNRLRKKNEELEHELENVVTKPLKSPDVLLRSTMERQDDELVEHYKILTDELEEKIEILEATLSEKDSQMRRVQEQYEEILNNLKKKEDHIVDLEFELLSANNQEKDKHDSSATTSNTSGQIATLRTKSHLATLLEERDAEIERLNDNLAKRNCDLQGLVNNELWRKNREIEKLERRHATEVLHLQGELSSKDIQLRLIKEKISEAGVDIDSNGNASEDRQEEGKCLQLELKNSEKLRVEAQELCTVLSGRLEELAVFLDSLLKQKCVLGFLGGKENRRLRQIIDQSLDLSRSFTASMMIGNPNESLLQLSNLTSLLNDTTIATTTTAENMSLTYKSHLYGDNGHDALDNGGNGEMVIAALRQQIVNLKYELQLRDVELNRLNSEVHIPIVELPNSEVNMINTTSTTIKYQSDNQSESESWSEPDRVVSRARIGLDIDSSSMSALNPKSNPSSDSTADEMLTARSLRTPPKRQMQDRQLLSEQLEAEKAANVQLRATLEALEEQLAKSTDAIEILRADAKEKLRAKIAEVEMEKREALSIAKEAEEVAGLAKDEIKSAEAKLRGVQKEMSELDAKLRLQYESEFVNGIKSVTQQAEQELSSLRQVIEQLRSDCARNCVKKTELVATREDLERTQKLLRKSEETTHNLERECQNVKDKLSATQERVSQLRTELDAATLQYSEAVLEKTKIANEKTTLEQELSLTALKEVDLKKQFDEIQTEMSNIKLSYQRQIGTLQQHKARLEMKASELESANAELHNRLIKIGCGDAMFSSSLPNASHFGQVVAYRRQVSDVSTSDDSRQPQPIPVRTFALNPVDFERHEANSSPDLGIESDHGRFSSLETVSRPLLQTLELTESMSNLLDGENQNNDDNQHCCQKSLEMAHENTDLKRKLLRTRRALEETVTQLTLANQRKKQVEKTICKQIHKTSQVLRKAKANLDSGSESEVVQKRL